MTSADDISKTPPGGIGEHPLPCDEIQSLMLDFMQHDLGEARSDLVREHTRRCPACHAHMLELQETVGILHASPFTPAMMPQHLSERHHDRLVRALMHPVWDWIYVHHILVSALVAVVVIATVFFGLRHYKVLRERTDPGIPVVIGDAPGE